MSVTKPSREAEPVVFVELNEYSIEPEASVVPSGPVKIRVLNRGDEPHDLVLLRTEHSAEDLPTEDGRVVLDGIAEAGRVPECPPGDEGEMVVELTPGPHVLVCSAPGHYQRGMRIGLEATDIPTKYDPDREPPDADLAAGDRPEQPTRTDRYGDRRSSE